MDLFGTAGIRGDVNSDVTPARALAVGRATGVIARGRGIETVVVGRDGRVTGPGLTAAVAAGLMSAGVDVRRAGELPTPALAFASRNRFGVMITASHNPPHDNGLKLFVDSCEVDSSVEERVGELIQDGVDPVDWDEWGNVEPESVLDAYRATVVEFARGIGAPLDGLSIAVDCGNGTGALATPQVLVALGADVTAIHANVDGHFPARPSKPTRETLGEYCDFVDDGGFVVGFAHDGDADRVVVIDSDGDIVHEDTILAVLGEYYVGRSDADVPTVITTPNASTRIDERVEAAGGRTVRVSLGGLHEGIKSATERGEAVAFAAEPWKHLHPALGNWIDGVASAAILSRLVAEADGLDPLVESVAELPYRKGSVECPDDRKEAVMAAVADGLPERFPAASVDDEHGVRLDGPGGWWLLVRPSGTEPLIRLYAEGEEADELLNVARAAVEAAISGG